MSTTHDTRADRATAKPAACGACGAERLGRGFRDWKVDGRYRRESKILCACGVEGPWAPCHPATDEAIAAWNAMWAPRAGEATKHLAKVVADHQRSKVGRIGSHFMVVMTDEMADAAVAELGLAAGREEARG